MRFYSIKYFAEATGLKKPTVRKHIRLKKIEAKKDTKDCYLIPESELNRFLEEKEKFDKGKYLTADCLEKKDLPRKILFDGSVETETLLFQTCASWEEVKGWMKRNPSNCILRFERHGKTLQILNKKGIHCEPSTIICAICKRYYDNSHTQCEIFFDTYFWHYPTDRSAELLKMEISYLSRVVVVGIGVESKELLKALAQVFNNKFGLERA